MNVNYQIMEPPVFKPFEDMTKQEAKEYFNFFCEQIPIRIAYLQNWLNENTKEKVQLDYTEHSLVAFWTWFTEFAIDQKEKHFTENTPLNLPYAVLGIADDFSIYYGEYVIKHYPNVRWGYNGTAKHYVYYNQPVLRNFEHRKDEICPSVAIAGRVRRIFEEPNPNAILEMYQYLQNLEDVDMKSN